MEEIEIWDVSSISVLGDWQDGTIRRDLTVAKGVGVRGEAAESGTCWAWIDFDLNFTNRLSSGLFYVCFSVRAY